MTRRTRVFLMSRKTDAFMKIIKERGTFLSMISFASPRPASERHNKKRRMSPVSAAIIASAVTAAASLTLGASVLFSYREPIMRSIMASPAQSTAPDSALPATALQESHVISTVKRTNPAVVAITITKDVPVFEQFDFGPFGGLFGQDFFAPQFNGGTERREVGGGSGFFVSSDGYIVTNRHVVSDRSADYAVFTNDGKSHSATIAALDPDMDVAILKIEGTGYSYLEFGDSDTLEVGQTAIAIGNALGEFRNTVSVGVVSGLGRSVVAGDTQGNVETLEKVIQTDAAINPGNSGGPLLDLRGRVIGVNVAIVSGSQNIGFALPSNDVRKALGEVGR